MKKGTFTKLLIGTLLLTGSFTLTLQAQSWVKLNTTFTEGVGDIFFVNNANGFLVAGGTAYKTTDAGVTWTNMNVNPPAGVNLNAIYAYYDFGGTTVYVTGNIQSTSGDSPVVMKSADGGDNWTTLTIPLTNGFMNTIYGFDADNIFVGGGEAGNGGMILKTTDGGANWTKTTMGTDVAFFSHIEFGSATSGIATGLEGTPFQNGTLYYTSDGGDNWTKGAEPSAIMNTAATLSSTSYYAGDGDGNVWLTFDNGATWSQTLTTPVSTSIRDMVFPTSTVGFAVTDGAVLIGTNGGQTWNTDPSFPGTERLFAMHIDAPTNTIYVAGDNGAVYRFGQSISVAEEKAIEFKMYPNPATSNVSVKAETPITSIEVYDIQGRNVLTVQPDTKEYSLSISSLANGAYNLKVFTEKGTATQKLMKN